MKKQGLPSFPPRVMTYYERKYARLKAIADNIGDDAPLYRVHFYVNSEVCKLIKETKIHYYFVENSNNVIIRVAKKSYSVYLFYPNYGTITSDVICIMKIEKQDSPSN